MADIRDASSPTGVKQPGLPFLRCASCRIRQLQKSARAGVVETKPSTNGGGLPKRAAIIWRKRGNIQLGATALLPATLARLSHLGIKKRP